MNKLVRSSRYVQLGGFGPLIPITVQRLEPRQKESLRGCSHNFEVVLLLTTLVDKRLYVASEIAAMMVEPKEEPMRYKRLRDSIYQRAHRFGLTEYNQNLNRRGEPMSPAKWNGFHWKLALNDTDWAKAVSFYEGLQSRDGAHRRLGHRLHYFYDEDIGLIETTANDRSQVRQWLCQGSWDQQPFLEHWRVTTMLAPPTIHKPPLETLTRANSDHLDPSAQENHAPVGKHAAKRQPAHWWPSQWHFFRSQWQRAMLVLFTSAILLTLGWSMGQPGPLTQQWQALSQLAHRDHTEAVPQLWHLLQEPLPTDQRTWALNTLLAHCERQPDAKCIPMLRELYALATDRRERIAGIIAQCLRDEHWSPLFPRKPTQPVFVASIDGNPMVLFETGLVRPGDWLHVDRVTGYVSHIDKHGLFLTIYDAKIEVRFQPLALLGRTQSYPGNVVAYQGTANLQAILSAVADVAALPYVDPRIDGHLGGSWHAQSYADFLNQLAQQTPLILDDNQVFTSNTGHFIVQFGLTGLLFVPITTDELVPRFAKQIGLPITGEETLLPKNHTVELINAQWSQVLDSFGLRCAYDPVQQQLQLSHKG